MALMSVPTAKRSGPAYACPWRPEPRVSAASTTEAPPCEKLSRGLGVALDGHRRDHPVGVTSAGSTPIRSLSAPMWARMNSAISSCDVMGRLATAPGRQGCRSVSVESPGASETTRPRLLLLDGPRWPTAPFFAPGRELLDRDEQNTNAVYGFTSMLVNVLRDEQPTHRGGRLRRLAPDLPHGGVRRVQGEAQQDAGEFSSQLPLIERMLDNFSIPYLKAPGYGPTTSSRRWSPRRWPTRPAAWRSSSSPATVTRCSWSPSARRCSTPCAVSPTWPG